MKTSKAYLFLGPPGSAKTTQANLLTKELRSKGLDVCDFNTGRCIRELAESEDSLLKRKIKKSLTEGLILPSAIPISLWGHKFVNEHKADLQWVCDGIARKFIEAEIFINLCKFAEVDQMVVIFLNLEDEQIMERLKERGRVDDDSETVLYRIKQYRSETEKSIDFMSNYGEYIQFNTINAYGSIEEVHKRVKDCISDL